jgi:ribosomal protein S18 acetylase RimI-like enzyme
MAPFPTYSLRDVADDDYAFLYALHEQTLRSYVERTWGWDDADQHIRFRAEFDSVPRMKIVVCEGQDVGVLAVEESASSLFVRLVEIAPAWQRRGLGTRILETVAESGRSRGLPTRLQVLKVNPARRLYERLGFKEVGETPTHYIMEL